MMQTILSLNKLRGSLNNCVAFISHKRLNYDIRRQHLSLVEASLNDKKIYSCI